VLPWLETATCLRVIVETEELATGFENYLIRPVDPEHVGGVFFDGNKVAIALEVVAPTWEGADPQGAQFVAGGVSDRGFDGPHVTR
jgi:hypothetical protein